MKLSILLPTRDRLDLLRYAVESVRMQDYADWEIVVSDNASAEDVQPYVASLADARVRCYRQQAAVPVTDNWNAALERSTGEYLIMLGDDDALMPGCLRRAAQLLEQWSQPDAIYAQALQFAYPGTMPGHAEGFVQTGYTEFFRAGRGQPFLLARGMARRLVLETMRFRIRFGYNMQHFVVSRALVDSLRPKGPFFQSPYPDYYAANAVLLRAERIVAEPRPLTMVGISPKSFGFYFHNQREGEGVAFLQNTPAAAAAGQATRRLVPGSNMNDSWLAATEALAANFAGAPGLRVNYRRYRLLQYNVLLKQSPGGGLGAVLSHMHWWEYLYYLPAATAFALTGLLPGPWRRALQERLRAALSAYPRFDPQRRTVGYRNILEATRGEAGAGSQ